MKRVGECLRCGRCCRGEHLFDSLGIIARLFLLWKVGLDGYKAVRLKRCAAIRYRRDGSSYCGIYKTRPWFCRAYPARKSDLIDGCGFRFER